MEGEMYKFMEVWLSIFMSLCYCYAIGKLTLKGATRFFCVLPIVFLFLVLPLYLSSIHLGCLTAFFISWLANFKLLLFAFGTGPLSSSDPPSISLGRFLAVACLPIKIQPNPSSKSHVNSQNKETPTPKSLPNGQNITDPPPKSRVSGQNKENPLPESPKKGHKSPLKYAIKGLILAMLIRVYDYSEYIHHSIILVLYSFHIYLCLDIILAMVAALARALLQLELEPQFDDPYLSTSLQDFWGKRWNLIVKSILRPSVYLPVHNISTLVMGRKWASLPAIFATFLVSALMHELIFYNIGRVRPTWDITWFFILHGVCLMVEVAVKIIINDRYRLPRLVSGPLTLGFVMVTSFWLFFPQPLRFKADVRAFEEYAALGNFFKNICFACLRFRL